MTTKIKKILLSLDSSSNSFRGLDVTIHMTIDDRSRIQAVLEKMS